MRKVAVATAAALAFAGISGAALAFTGGFPSLKLLLNGVKEVPVVSTTGTGSFAVNLAQDGTSISYVLKYELLEGDITQAHIHIGPEQNTGGISVWLCSNLPFQPTGPTPLGVQPCPASPGQVSGVITASDVVGPAGQGVASGEFDELLNLIEAGKTYVNVHSSKFPGGEIRSQIVPSHSH
jgi:hypothetical protein